MVKEKKPETSVETQPKSNRHIVAKLLFVAALGGAGYALWANPQIVDQIKGSFDFKSSKAEQQRVLEDLSRQVKHLQNQVDFLSEQRKNDDYQEMKDKVAAIEKTNLNVIDSKADVATVLGIITRMDKAEYKLDNLAKVTDEGALILTSAMLVKDAAERGGQFEYEAEVLQEISKDNLKMREPVAVIVKYASEGVLPPEVLKNRFGKIYKAMLKEQKQAFEQSWTDRLNSKLSEFVQIKRVKEEAPVFEANQGLEIVKHEMENGNLAAAVKELGRSENADLLKNKALHKWYNQAKATVEFNQAVSKISASSLALMKVNFIRKTAKND